MRARWLESIDSFRPSSSTSDLRTILLRVETSTDPFELPSGPESSRDCSPEAVDTSSDSVLLPLSWFLDASLPCWDCFSSAGEFEGSRAFLVEAAILGSDSTVAEEVDRTRWEMLEEGREREEVDWKPDDEGMSSGRNEDPVERLVDG